MQSPLASKQGGNHSMILQKSKNTHKWVGCCLLLELLGEKKGAPVTTRVDFRIILKL